jgi:fluoride ion exporter CrcB/FEX
MSNQSLPREDAEGEQWDRVDGLSNSDDQNLLAADIHVNESTKTVSFHHIHMWNWAHIFSLTLFSIYGITIRSFMGRIFGGDCDAMTPINDWLTPISRHICVTATGKTEQYGGALFIDLPANMFGSFIMGSLTGHSKDWPVLPWLKHDHPLQYEDGLHLGLRTALCGTITTFSSWNAQMVLMMDGTGTYLGSQVVAALFGYVLGMQVSISCFRAGRTLAAWCHLKVNPHIFEVDVLPIDYAESEDSEHQLSGRLRLNSRVISSFIALALFVLYILGDFYWGIKYYRQLWISCLLGPFGTLLRWKLSTLNGKLRLDNWKWFPIGTFSSNFIGSIVSSSINAIFTASLVNGYSLTHDILAGMVLGFAGCLSTVSSMVKEVTEITEKNPHFDKKAFVYSYGTLVSCSLIGLLVYCPIVRLL